MVPSTYTVFLFVSLSMISQDNNNYKMELLIIILKIKKPGKLPGLTEHYKYQY